MAKNVTLIPYLYRDEHNYKQKSFLCLHGSLSARQVQAIKSKLVDGDGFIPFDLGLGIPELQEMMDTFPSDADHVFHELELDERELVAAAPEGALLIDASRLVEAFDAIQDENGWNVAAAMVRLGLADQESEASSPASSPKP